MWGHLKTLYYNTLEVIILKNKYMKNIRSTHDKIREILQSNGCEEFGDCIIDEICKAFNFPTTTSVEYFTELAFDSNVSFSQFQREVAEVEFGNLGQNDEVGNEFANELKQFLGIKISENHKDLMKIMGNYMEWWEQLPMQQKIELMEKYSVGKTIETVSKIDIEAIYTIYILEQ